jgi:hypothetical protein
MASSGMIYKPNFTRTGIDVQKWLRVDAHIHTQIDLISLLIYFSEYGKQSRSGYSENVKMQVTNRVIWNCDKYGGSNSSTKI